MESVITEEQKFQNQQQPVAGLTWRKGAAPKDGVSPQAVAYKLHFGLFWGMRGNLFKPLV